jgi:hypothetical protein
MEDSEWRKMAVDKAFQTSSAITGFVVVQTFAFIFAMGSQPLFNALMDCPVVSVPTFIGILFIICLSAYGVFRCHCFISSVVKERSLETFNKQQKLWRPILIIAYGFLSLLMVAAFKPGLFAGEWSRDCPDSKIERAMNRGAESKTSEQFGGGKP